MKFKVGDILRMKLHTDFKVEVVEIGKKGYKILFIGSKMVRWHKIEVVDTVYELCNPTKLEKALV